MKLDHISKSLRPLAVPIAGLVLDQANARTHGERNIEAIKASLMRFGQQAPVLFVVRDRRKIVIKGNGVLAAAKALRWTHLAAVACALTGDDATAFAIADNRTTDLSDFDPARLAEQLQELEEADYDIAAAGFTDEELQELVDDLDGPEGQPIRGEAASRHRGERTALFLAGHLKFEVPRKDFDRWLSAVETKVGNDPDRVVAEIKRRLKIGQ